MLSINRVHFELGKRILKPIFYEKISLIMHGGLYHLLVIGTYLERYGSILRTAINFPGSTTIS